MAATMTAGAPNAAAPNAGKAILDLFEDGRLSGIYLPGLKIYPAKAGSSNAGALYVVGREKAAPHDDWHGASAADSGRTYYGKITRQAVWAPTDAGRYWAVTELLEALAAGGVDYLAKVGIETGNCCFCGLDLTDPESVRYGYGPVCARKHGLPHTNRHGY